MSRFDLQKELEKSIRIGLVAARDIHMDVKGGPGWCAGIAHDPRRRLLEHRVDLSNPDNYRIREFEDVDEARNAAGNLHGLGCKGGSAGGDERSRSLYIYKITRETCQTC